MAQDTRSSGHCIYSMYTQRKIQERRIYQFASFVWLHSLCKSALFSLSLHMSESQIPLLVETCGEGSVCCA